MINEKGKSQDVKNKMFFTWLSEKKKKMNRKHDKSLSFYHLICILHMVLTTEGFLEVAIESWSN